MFQDGQEVELQTPPPALWLEPKVPNSFCQSLEVCTFGGDERDSSRAL